MQLPAVNPKQFLNDRIASYQYFDFSEDGENWEVYFNLNANGNPPWGGGGFGTCDGGTCAQARYPSAAASPDFPYAIWNEYTGETTFGSTYGGRPYYSYDNFE